MFLAPDGNRLKDLEQAVRQFLAWKSIWEEREALNLDPFQSRQAETKRRSADETVDARIPETYQWLLVPGQTDSKGSVEWNEIRQQGQDSLAVRASKKLKNEEMLLVQLGGTRLRHELDRIPLWRGNHVGIKQLIDDFATYLYLPRLRDEDVLIAAVRDGLGLLTWQSETFAYAESWDEQKQQYKGLQAGQSVRVLADGKSLLVKPDVATVQMEAEKREPITGEGKVVLPGITASGSGGPAIAAPESPGTGAPQPVVLRRFHGSVKLDSIRIGRDASRIGEEVVQHLSGLVRANVEVTLEIQASIPDGAPEKTVRDVTENCRTLKFESYGFEED